MTPEWLGFAGTTLVILAFLPQIIHLIKEHCSWGVSEAAYVTWAMASLLLLFYAISMKNAVFIALQSYQFGANVLICFYCNKYKNDLCENHA